MSDKARVFFPIAVEFTAGELPSASKLNGLSRQTKQGLSVIEYQLGDLWNQAGDALLSGISNHGSALMIPNIARYIGAAKYLSPRIPYLPNIEAYTHKFTSTTGAGSYEYRLPFPAVPIASGGSFSWSSGRSSTPTANKGDVDTSTEWWIDTDNGDLYVSTAFATNETLTYRPVVEGDLGQSATFNIIPDLDTHLSYNFGSVKIAYKNGTDAAQGYEISLPPRMPLDSRRVSHSPQDDVHDPAHSGNMQSSPGTLDMLFWQDDSVDAIISPYDKAEHYRYTLPKIITDYWSNGSAIPAGMLYLWDVHSSGTGTIIEGVTFAAESIATPNKWKLIATGTNLTTWLSTTVGQSLYPSSALTAPSDHSTAMYPTNGLRLIAVGSDVSQAFSSLLAQFLNHDHKSTGSLVTRGISHGGLTELFSSSATYGAAIGASGLSDVDDHPQYLERHGYQGDRDAYNGSMLGDIHMASTGSSSNYLNITSDSNKISFGVSGATGSSLYWDSTYNKVHLKASTTPPNTGLRISDGGSTTAAIDITASEGSNNVIDSKKDLEIKVSNSGNFDIECDALTVATTGIISIGTPFAIGLSSSANNITLTATGNNINLVGDGTVLNTATITCHGNVNPSGTRNMGASDNRWNTIYVETLNANTISGTTGGDVNNDNVTCNNLTVNTAASFNGYINTNIIASGSVDIGDSGSGRWNAIYGTTGNFSGSVSAASLSTSSIISSVNFNNNSISNVLSLIAGAVTTTNLSVATVTSSPNFAGTNITGVNQYSGSSVNVTGAVSCGSVSTNSLSGSSLSITSTSTSITIDSNDDTNIYADGDMFLRSGSSADITLQATDGKVRLRSDGTGLFEVYYGSDWHTVTYHTADLGAGVKTYMIIT